MAKQNETGHVINVDNFYELMQFPISYGTQYAPPMAALQITQLNIKYTASQNIMQSLLDELTVYNNLVNARQQVFADRRPLATRIINILATSGASKEIVEDAKTINRKIQGQRATPKTPLEPDTSAPRDISASQMSFAQTISHWAELISLLESEPLYAPTDVALQADTLSEMHETMVSANEAVAAAHPSVAEKMNERDEIMYAPDTGLVAVAALVKQYIKGLFGARSPQFKDVNRIKFRTFKRR